jgi:hypothetical protein
MMNTPRTDAAARHIDGFQWVPRYISEELERELQEANDYADRLVAHKDMVCLPADLANLREGNAHFAAENEALRKTIKQMYSENNEFCTDQQYW